MRSTTPRTCPHCGATNTGRSLFCAECGANLNEPADPHATRPFAPGATAADDSLQQTEAYAPAWNQDWSSRDQDATGHDAGQQPQAAPPIHTPVAPVHPDEPASKTTLAPADTETSSRGFYLGLIAILLIIAIALILGWLTLIQPNL